MKNLRIQIIRFKNKWTFYKSKSNLNRKYQNLLIKFNENTGIIYNPTLTLIHNKSSISNRVNLISN